MSVKENSTILDSFNFRPQSGTYLARYDRTKTPASTAIVATLSEILHADPTEMDVLFHSVDTESLDAILGRCDVDDVRITCTFAGHEVTVTDSSVTAIRTHDGKSVGTGAFVSS